MPLGKQRFSPGWTSLADPETNRLPSFVPLDALLLAERVELHSGVLRFDWKSGLDFVKPPSTLLERFLGLRTDDGILGFARRFGPLGLSDDGEEAPADPKAFELSRREQRESLRAWRRYQWEFNSLLTLAAALRERETPKREIFEAFDKLGVFAPSGSLAVPWASILDRWSTSSLNDRLAAASEVLVDRTTTFVRWCKLRPALTWSPWAHRREARATLAFQDATSDNFFKVGLSLFGALTVQLLAAATGSGFAVCSACGSVFVPRRRQPAFGKRRYCRACGRTAALKDAKADYRARERAKEAARRSAK